MSQIENQKVEMNRFGSKTLKFATATTSNALTFCINTTNEYGVAVKIETFREKAHVEAAVNVQYNI